MSTKKVTAQARHILVKDEATCNDLINQLNEGADFSALAKKHSTCPSGQKGGDLGSFQPGMMVKEFNDVVFDEPVGVYPKPVKTQFGYHVIETLSRN
jgi:peptidyl-prolyl cis-trans isomerase C